MADPKVQILIEAKNGAKQVLKELAADATAAGKALDTAGTTGAQGLQKADQAADKAAESVENVGEAAQKAEVDMKVLGAAATMVGAGLVYSSNKAMEQERQIVGLTRAYGDASDEMLQFAEDLDEVTMFSDDDIRAGERYFASLRNNYDLSIDQIQELMRVTAELAAASGTSFEDASSRVTAAIRGEGEAAEYLGLTMNQQSIDRENLTLTMSNQEAAQFRLNALMQQATPYIGTNNDMLQTSAGTVAEWRDRVDDAAASVGNFIGPVGTLATGAATLGFGLTSVVGGMTTLRALPAQITAGFGRMNTVITGSSRLMAALSLATGPVGIGIAAVAAVGALLWASFREGDEAAAALNSTLTDLDTTIENLRIRGENDLAALGEDFKATAAAFQEVSLGIDDMTDAQVTSLAQQLSGIRMEAEAAREWLKDFNPELEIKVSVSDEDLAAVNRKVDKALNDPDVDAEAFIEWANGVLEAAAATETLADDAVALQTILEKPLSDFSIHRYTESVTGLGAAFRLVMGEADGFLDKIMKINEVTEDDSFLQKFMKTLGMDATDRAAVNETLGIINDIFSISGEMPGPGAGADEWREWINEEGISQTERSQRIKVATEAQRENAAATKDATEATQRSSLALLVNENALYGMEAARRRATAAMADKAIAGALEEQERYAEHIQLVTDNLNRLYDVAGYGDPLSQWNLAGHATEASLLAMNINQAATALDDVFRVVVGNTDAISDQANSVLDWATELINVEGEYGKIDDLLASGLITQQQWTEAQGAFNSIAQDTASIQEYTLKIQAMQAPLIAEQTAALENQMDIIANLPADQQLIALGWMDAATAARAMEFQTLAVAAANSELGEQGEETYARMIAGAARADPVLKALLIDMGLISEGADGTITVHLSGQDQAMSEIEAMTVAMVEWMDLADDGMKNRSVTFEILGLDDPREKIKDVKDQAVALDGTVVDVDANVNVNDPYQLLAPNGLFSDDFLGHLRDSVITIPVKLAPPTESPFSDDFLTTVGNIPTVLVPVDADTAPMDRKLLDLALNQPEPIKLPVEFDYSTIGDSGHQDANGLGAPIGPITPISIPATVTLDQTAFDTAMSDIEAAKSSGETVSVTIGAVDNAGPVLDDLQVRLFGLTVGPWMATITADNSQAAESLNAVVDTFNALVQTTGVVVMNGDNSGAMAALGDTATGLAVADTWSATVDILGDNSGAMAAIGDVSTGIAVADTWSATVSILGDNSGALQAIAEMQAFDQLSLATTYVDIVTRHSSQGIPGDYLGGIAGYANGGVVVELAENGPEMLHFAAGGTALISNRGIYEVPAATYVSPNNAVGNSFGGHTFYISVSGGDAAEIKRVFTSEIMPAVIATLDENRRSAGVY